MRTWFICAMIFILPLMDAATLYQMFFSLTKTEPWILYLLTFGIAIILDFIPLVMGRYIHYWRYRANGVRPWMIVGLAVAFFLLFGTTSFFRWEMRYEILGNNNSAISVTTGNMPSSKMTDGGKAAAYTLLMGTVPLVTSVISLALGYLTSDPIKRKLINLKIQKAAVLEQLAQMKAAELELDQNWAASLDTLETLQLKAAEDSVRECSEHIRQLARFALAEKLGDADSISELTDNSSAGQASP